MSISVNRKIQEEHEIMTLNYRDTSIRTIGDFACGDQLIQLDQSRTANPARSIFAMQSITL